MPKKKNNIKWFILVNAIVLFLLIISFGREYIGNLQIEREIANLEAQKQDLNSQQLDTLNLISELSSEYYLEEEGRAKQGLGREGETLVIIQDKDTDEQNLDYSEGVINESNNLVKWFYYFFARSRFEEIKKI